MKIKISICIISCVLLIIFLFSDNKILGLVGFLSLGLMESYDFFTKYKNTGNVPWLDILYILISISGVINILSSIF